MARSRWLSKSSAVAMACQHGDKTISKRKKVHVVSAQNRMTRSSDFTFSVLGLGLLCFAYGSVALAFEFDIGGDGIVTNVTAMAL